MRLSSTVRIPVSYSGLTAVAYCISGNCSDIFFANKPGVDGNVITLPSAVGSVFITSYNWLSLNLSTLNSSLTHNHINNIQANPVDNPNRLSKLNCLSFIRLRHAVL